MSDEPQQKQPAWIHWVLDHPKLAGLGAAIALAVAFTPKASTLASWICLGVAVVFGIAMLFGFADKREYGMVFRSVSVVLFLVLIVVFGIWLTDGKQPLEEWCRSISDRVNPPMFPGHWRQPRKGALVPPQSAYNRAPPPSHAPALRNPIDLVTLSTLDDSFIVRNQSSADLYIVDIQISQKQNPDSAYFKLGFDLPSGHIKDFPLKGNPGVELHSLGVQVGTTWNDIVQEATRQYGMPCLAFVYFSVHASGLATMETYYKAHGGALSEGDATGTIHYRSPNSPQDKTQNLPLIVTLMRNRTPPCPI
jgi:hypothetical protein